MNEITVAFAVVPAPRAFIWAFLLLGALPILLTSGAVYALTKTIAPGITAMVVILGVAMFSASLFVFLSNDISLTDQSLKVKSAFFGRTVDRSEIIWADARMINSSTDSELLPKVRTSGIGLPGYAAGWFVLRNGTRAFMLTTEDPLLYLPVADGSALVLSVDTSSTLFQTLQREYQIEANGR